MSKLLIVDDEIKIREVIRKYAESDSRIIIINSDVRSYGYQVNVGIKNARGRYIAILETDDWIASDMYETLYNVAVRTVVAATPSLYVIPKEDSIRILYC